MVHVATRQSLHLRAAHPLICTSACSTFFIVTLSLLLPVPVRRKQEFEANGALPFRTVNFPGGHLQEKNNKNR